MSALAGAAALQFVQPAQAQQETQQLQAGSTLEEVIVSARRRDENLQTVPVTVNVLSQDQISERGNVAAWDLAQMVPGLQENAFTDRSNVDFAIRGQTHTFGTLAAAVVTYFAEVPLPRVSKGEFFDLANIQVLKGPQGTLFGRVTNGGAILLSPRRPGKDFGGYVELRGGDFSLLNVLGAVDVPLSERLSMRLATNINRRDGFTRNLFDGRDLDNVHEDSYRVSLTAAITDSLENYTVLSYNTAEEDCCGSVLSGVNPNNYSPANFAIIGPAFAQQLARGPRSVNAGGSDARYYKGGIYLDHEARTGANVTTLTVSDTLSFKNIIGYAWTRDYTGNDGDGVANAPFGDNLGLGTEYPIYFNYRELVSDELQVQGSLLDDRLSYTVGTYWDQEKTPGTADQYAIVNNIAQASVVQYATTKSKAAYAQLGYNLTSALKLDLGLRYTDDSVESRNAQYLRIGVAPAPLPLDGQCLTAAEVAAQFPGAIAQTPCRRSEASFTATTYTAGLSYQATDHTFIYGTVRRGYRAGGFNAASGGLVNPAYDPEFTLSREAGIKADWELGAVQARTNLTAFWDTTTDSQQYVSSLEGATVSSGVVNGARQTVKGLELQALLVPVDGLTFDLVWSYSDGEYDTDEFTSEEIAASCPADPYLTAPAPNGIVCPLQRINNLPKNVFTFGVDYTLPLPQDIGRITLGSDWYYTSPNAPGSSNSRQYPTDFAPNGGMVPSYSLVNLNAGWQNVLGRPLDVSLFVTNVGDKEYIQNYSNYLNRGSLGFQTAFYGAPRMWGISVRYNFGSQ